MRDQGGFEGNAQTLRILTRLEKKETVEFPVKSPTPRLFDGHVDLRTGLNLTMRSLASILKYDELIPHSRDHEKIRKGYYSTERDLVYKIKEHVVGDRNVADFRTIECSIMDLADDIAYSTYDLEDAFKNGFLSPVSMMSLDDNRKHKIADEVSAKMREEHRRSGGGSKPEEISLTADDVNDVFLAVFESIYSPSTDLESDRTVEELNAIASTQVYSRSSELCDDGYLRSDFTSKLVHLLIQGIEF